MTQNEERQPSGLNEPVSKADMRNAALMVGAGLVGVVIWYSGGSNLFTRKAQESPSYAAAQTASGLAATPDPAKRDWEENGLEVFSLGDTALAGETTLSRWSGSDWWFKLRQPKISKDAFGPLRETSNNGVATSYEVTAGPLTGAKVVDAANGQQLSVWSAEYVRNRP